MDFHYRTVDVDRSRSGRIGEERLQPAVIIACGGRLAEPVDEREYLGIDGRDRREGADRLREAWWTVAHAEPPPASACSMQRRSA